MTRGIAIWPIRAALPVSAAVPRRQRVGEGVPRPHAERQEGDHVAAHPVAEARAEQLDEDEGIDRQQHDRRDQHPGEPGEGAQIAFAQFPARAAPSRAGWTSWVKLHARASLPALIAQGTDSAGRHPFRRP
jgi:hypothetical protein